MRWGLVRIWRGLTGDKKGDNAHGPLRSRFGVRVAGGWPTLIDHKKRWSVLLLATALRAADPLLFVYFKEPANMGVFYALSDDGYHCRAHGGSPWIGIEHASELMRDPFLTRGPDGEFHLVWTWGWRGQSIGYALRPTWCTGRAARDSDLMAGTPGTRNTWAPEIYWDAAKAEWMASGSSAVEGRHEGNRLYYARTRDFRTFTPPAIFFDPGYVVIDATLLQTRDRYYMVFKDERNEPDLHRCLRSRGRDRAHRSVEQHHAPLTSPGRKARPSFRWATTTLFITTTTAIPNAIRRCAPAT